MTATSTTKMKLKVSFFLKPRRTSLYTCLLGALRIDNPHQQNQDEDESSEQQDREGEYMRTSVSMLFVRAKSRSGRTPRATGWGR